MSAAFDNHALAALRARGPMALPAMLGARSRTERARRHGAAPSARSPAAGFSREHELTRAGFCGRCGNVIKDDVLVREGASGSAPGRSA